MHIQNFGQFSAIKPERLANDDNTKSLPIVHLQCI